MLMTSTRKFNQTTTANSGIYTRSRQLEYKNSIHNKTEEKKISEKSLYALVFLVVILLFCSWFGMIFFKSIISGVQMEVNAVNKQIRELEQENSLNEALKINAVDIESIKLAAENMGMSLPGALQVEYVDTADASANLKILD